MPITCKGAPYGAYARLLQAIICGLSILILASPPIAAQISAVQRPPVDQTTKRPVTVVDTIQMTRFADPDYWYGASSQGRVAQFSPDGRMFVVILRKGNIDHNTNEFSLLLWKTGDLFRHSHPEVLLTMASSSNRPAIQDVRWLFDNETLMFLGENPGQPQQLYKINIRTRSVTKVTESATSIVSYDMTPTGERVAYLANRRPVGLFGGSALREGAVVPRGEILDSFIMGLEMEPWEESKDLFVISHGGFPQPIRSADHIQYGSGENRPLISPDGKHIILLSYVDDVPAIWKQYSDDALKKWISPATNLGQHAYISEYTIIDTRTLESRALLNSPVLPWDTEAAWSPDSRSVVIGNAFLPLENAQDDERKERQVRAFAAEVKVPTGEISKISDENLTMVEWDEKTNEVVFQSGRLLAARELGPRIYFRKSANQWVEVTNRAPDKPQPDVVLDEGMASAPRIVALDPVLHRKAVLFDLNPQFKNLEFGRVMEITWKGTDGRTSVGGLYYPVDYTPGKKYPLVIQTHGWTSKRFLIDGVFTTAFAAQPLAGKGVMVLQMAELGDDPNYDWYYASVSTPREAARAVASYEGAINHLDSLGLIDVDHVGIIGFSRTCYYVKYALTHSKYRFAAASVTDGFDGGYLQYLAYDYADPKDMDGVNGGSPFGNGLDSWIGFSPGFNLDKVHTPIQILAIHPGASEWEWFAGLSRLGKPVDMIALKDGEHGLQKPWDRLISLQSNVDWFCFWLKGEEDPDPSKARQYGRWRELRKLQEKNESVDDNRNKPN